MSMLSRFFCFVPSVLLIAFSACSSSTTVASPDAADVDAANEVDAGNKVVANDAETDALDDAGSDGAGAIDGNTCDPATIPVSCASPSAAAYGPAQPLTCLPVGVSCGKFCSSRSTPTGFSRFCEENEAGASFRCGCGGT